MLCKHEGRSFKSRPSLKKKKKPWISVCAYNFNIEKQKCPDPQIPWPNWSPVKWKTLSQVKMCTAIEKDALLFPWPPCVCTWPSPKPTHNCGPVPHTIYKAIYVWAAQWWREDRLSTFSSIWISPEAKTRVQLCVHMYVVCCMPRQYESSL